MDLNVRRAYTGVVFLAFVILLLCGTAWAQEKAPAKMENIALGKPYTFNISPSYRACTDPNDKTDLTDGITGAPDTSKGVSWKDTYVVGINKSCVGWYGRWMPATITVDLGKIELIGGAAYSTPAHLPGSIMVSVSLNGRDFHDVGDLIRLAEGRLPRPNYGGIFRSTKLKARARYVRFTASTWKVMVFCNEVEVYRGPEELSISSLNYPAKEAADRLTRIGCYRRIRWDLEETQGRLMDSSLSPAQTKQALSDLKQIRAKLDKSQFPEDSDSFKAIVPYNDIHRSVFSVYSRVLAAEGAKPLTIWQSPRYELMKMFLEPGEPISDLKVAMVQNERRSEVFNITNASEQEKIITFTIDGMDGGTNPDFIKPHQVEYVDTASGMVVASALVPIELNAGTYTTTVPSGMTRQIWLSFDTKNLKAGKQFGRINITSDSFKTVIGLRLSIAPIRFPDQPTCRLTMWDYTTERIFGTAAITRENYPLMVKDLEDHLIGAVWTHHYDIGFPVPGPEDVDEQGNLITELDFSPWGKFVKIFPKARYYMLAMWQNHQFMDKGEVAYFAGKKQGTEEFERAISQWVAAWAEYNRKIGLEPGKSLINFLDEPGDEAWMKALYFYAKAVKAGSEDIGLFQDPGCDVVEGEYGRKALELSDVICPHYPAFRKATREIQKYYEDLADRGKELWFYDCRGPAKGFKTEHYRLQAWHAFRHGGRGTGFFCYVTGAGNHWNEYTMIGRDAGPAYISPDSVTNSKHWEAARESLMDYEYLKTLKDRLEELEKVGAKSPLFEEAQQLLVKIPGTCADADEIRLAVLDMLEKLEEIK